MLDDLLMGTPVAPLYKALRESGLGESVISDGLETVLQQVSIVAIVFDTLRLTRKAGDLFCWPEGCGG